MFLITVDATGPLATTEKMLAQLSVFPTKMQDEMFNWQAEDMRRRHPRQKLRNRGKRVTTIVYPRGRRHYKKATRPYHLKKRRHPRRISTRPILRAELYDKLRSRMTDLLETIRWV